MHSSKALLSAMTFFALSLVGSAQAQVLQDPTRPSVSVQNAKTPEAQRMDAGGFPRVVVTAVLLNDKSRQAVLNGEVVSEGQRWSGMDVVKVHRHGVVLAKDEKRREFLIHAKTIVKEHANEF